MLAMTSPHTVSFSDTTLLRMLSSRNHRPNLLIQNSGANLESVLRKLSAVCELPIKVCRFPGILDLEVDGRSTLVLADVDQMTMGQQVMLSDWLGRAGKRVRVVSITRAPMTERITEGLFLEGLFFRLNTVVIRAVNHGAYCASW